jgi:hypothetical protein
VALAIGLEVFVGAAILLLSPRGRSRRSPVPDDRSAHESRTEPIDVTRLD